MKVSMFYKDASEHGRVGREFLRDFEHQTGKKIEVVDPDSPAGAKLCEIYDIMQYPTLLASDNEGHMLQMWVGEPLPRISEVSYYVD
jgi:hypothetical protein